jgi:VanZ family protein
MKKLITLFLVLTTGVSLAICTEIIQGTMEYRSFEFWDLAADIAGMLTCTMALAAYILSKNRKRHQNE